MIDANAVTEGDGNNLIYTVKLDRSTTKETSFAFAVTGDAIGAAKNIPNQVDYLNADNVTLTNGVNNNGDGSITIPAGVQSFSASVPVIDDSLIENTETAILSIGSLSGIGQIFDNDSSLAQNRPGSRPAPIVTKIKANTALEGADEDLIYRVSFDRRHRSSRHYQFKIGGDASYGLDYLTGKNVVITNGVSINNEGSITVPKGVKNFDVHVPVVDDNIIESTEIASIQIGRHKGIGQIFDNDGYASSTGPILEISDDNQGLTVSGPNGSGLWVKLQVQEGRDQWQNNFILINSKGKAVGTLGSTPQTHLYSKATLGDKHIYLEAGETIHFQQQSNNRKRVQTPRLEVTPQGSNTVVIALEDGRAGVGDFNDLVVTATTIIEPEDLRSVQTASKQFKTFDGVLNLNWLDNDQRLTLTTLKNTDPDNLIGLVPVTHNRSSGYTIDGVAATTPQAFRQALRDNLIQPDRQIFKNSMIKQSWNLSVDQAGLYAPVLITDDDLIFSFGKNTAADGKQHMKVLGENLFGFEDDLSGKMNDWHYDDVIVEATLV